MATLKQRLSYYREMRGTVLLIIGESITANLDYVCLYNQSHYSLDLQHAPWVIMFTLVLPVDRSLTIMSLGRSG